MRTHDKPNYSEFAVLPQWTQAQWGADVDGDRALLNESDPYKWSGDVAPPAIGSRVKCYMNALGRGTVLAYFVEYGWLGVLVQLDKNPKWRKEQHKGNPPAHLFGIDLQPRAKPVTIAAAAEQLLAPVAPAGGLREITEESMVQAHKAGIAYWRMNRPVDATRDALASHARSCGWHGDDNVAWIAGFYGEKARTK